MQPLKPVELSIEQEFALRAFETNVRDIELDEAKELLVQLYRLYLGTQAFCRQMLSNPQS